MRRGSGGTGDVRQWCNGLIKIDEAINANRYQAAIGPHLLLLHYTSNSNSKSLVSKNGSAVLKRKKWNEL